MREIEPQYDDSWAAIFKSWLAVAVIIFLAVGFIIGYSWLLVIFRRMGDH